MSKFTKGKSAGHRVLFGDGFHISYVEAAFDTGKPETALVVAQNEAPKQYYILNGDWQEAYEKVVVDGLEACMALYRAQESHHSILSHDFDVESATELEKLDRIKIMIATLKEFIKF